MKKRTMQFDAKQFMLEEAQKTSYKANVKQYLRQQTEPQLEALAKDRELKKSQTQEAFRRISADVQLHREEAVAKHEAMLKSRVTFKQGLDEQVAVIAQRVQEQLLKKQYESDEVKRLTLEHMRKVAADKAAQRKKYELEDKINLGLAAQYKSERSRDERILKETVALEERLKDLDAQAQYRALAQTKRLREKQDYQAACEKMYKGIAAKEDEMRDTKEQLRQQLDEEKHLLRSDLFYSTRATARERQIKKTQELLDVQVNAQQATRQLSDMTKQHDREVVDEYLRQHQAEELKKFTHKRREELINQKELMQQMQSTQQRHRAEGIRPSMPETMMQVTPGMLMSTSFRATTTPGRLSSPKLPEAEITQRMDAAQFLAKPCGKVEVKPWVDITRTRLGGVAGVLGGEGPLNSTLMATGGKGRILTLQKDLEKARMSQTWTEGLKPADFKTGLKAAVKRAAANALDKSDV